ncbi:carbohydrate binding domain-containing protein [Niastella populi]|uniref:PKD domain-containing protein n=1 Tax=Niastella populi TaxID=550983 RepID=A0A1V9FGU9_9BACT|nr:carbohydrate binding domain-containing protein [Niastella populi]OQP57560.1 hypothetical protein A4R26_23835 [Niastella populi]
MKQNSTLATVALIITSILLSLYSPAQNLITNSNFSNGATGWNGGCIVEIHPEPVYGGPNASNYVTEIDGETCLDQNVCIMPGFTYQLTFRATRRADANTPSTASISIKVRGNNSNTNYLNQAKGFNNTTFNWTTQSYTFTVPANSSDKTINIHIKDNNNSGTFGVLLDDIELHPQTDMAINGASSAVLNATYNYSVSNGPSSGITYNWSMGADASTATSTSATPSTKWTSAGNKIMSVVISNSSCVVATLTKNISVAGALPVTFTSFTGVIKDNKAALSWSTTNEVNNSYFIIERSINGRNFDSVGRVQAGSNSANNYSFSEINNNSSSYYRLKQVDLNGTFIYSAVITLKNAGSSREMTIYPAQAVTTIQYVIANEVQATATVQVFNMAGQPVISQKEVLSTGLNNRSLNVSHLAAGAYILKLQIAGTGVTAVKKFQKI